MKVKMARHSGLPIELDRMEEYKKCWRKYYDLVLDKYTPDMPVVQEKLEKLSDILNRRFSTIKDVELPKNQKQWLEFIKQYGDYGLCITTDMDKKELRFILLDQGL